MTDRNTTAPSGDKPPGRLAPVITWRSALVHSVDCSTCKLVGLVLSLHMNEIGGSAFPSNKTLAAECSLGISTVRDHLNNHLHAQGWLALVERGGTFDGRPKANCWQAVIPNDPRRELADPRRETADPRRQTASPPPGAGPQVVPEQVHEQEGVASEFGDLTCENCSATLNGPRAMADHYAECLKDFTPAADLLLPAGGPSGSVV